MTVPGVCCPYLLGLPISTRQQVYPASTVGNYVKIPDDAGLEVSSIQGKHIAEDDVETPFTTGQAVKVVRKGAVLVHTTVVVAGDVLGTGYMNVAQLVRIAQACGGLRPLSGAYLIAGDFSKNGRVDIADVVALAELMTGKQSS